MINSHAFWLNVLLYSMAVSYCIGTININQAFDGYFRLPNYMLMLKKQHK